MDSLPEPVPYPKLTAPAMIAVLLAGLTTATCGLQLLVFVSLPNAIGWAPAVLVLLFVVAQAFWIAKYLPDEEAKPETAAAPAPAADTPKT